MPAIIEDENRLLPPDAETYIQAAFASALKNEGISDAFATILIAITYSAVLLMNLVIRYFGTSRNYQES